MQNKHNQTSCLIQISQRKQKMRIGVNVKFKLLDEKISIQPHCEHPTETSRTLKVSSNVHEYWK